MSRPSRKVDHIIHALETGQQGDHGFEDVKIVHNCLPDLNMDDVQLSTHIGGLLLSSPIIINAMTGGAEQTLQVNQKLAILAREKGLAMAVGSQMAAIKDSRIQHTYKIVRQENPKGLIFANLGSEASVEHAKRAVDMIEADGLQIHLNVIQELVMPEGDRDFRGALRRIEQIVKQISSPIIIKEVGFGVSAEQAKMLEAIGVQVIDVGGFGGTNFATIENKRRSIPLEGFNQWGIQTVPSIVEVSHSTQVDVIASGGLQTPLDILKSLLLGAKAVGMAGVLLKILYEHDLETLLQTVEAYHEQLKKMLCALGIERISQANTIPVVILGESFQWLQVRGFDVDSLAQRN